jgi:hypothetical protein
MSAFERAPAIVILPERQTPGFQASLNHYWAILGQVPTHLAPRKARVISGHARVRGSARGQPN